MSSGFSTIREELNNGSFWIIIKNKLEIILKIVWNMFFLTSVKRNEQKYMFVFSVFLWVKYMRNLCFREEYLLSQTNHISHHNMRE